MGYFTYIASQSFKTDAEGRRVFCPGGTLVRPYVIDDPNIEARLRRKLTTYYAVFLPVLILALALAGPILVAMPWIFGAVLVGVLVVQWAILRLVLGPELRSLPRAPSRVRASTFYTDSARTHSTVALVLGVLGSLAFVATGVWLLLVAAAPTAVAVLAIVFFGLCAVAWGYALWLKLAQK